MKNGEKCLKNASFWVINFNNFRGGGVFRPPCRRKLIRRGKNDLKRGGGPENDRIAQYIPL